MRAKRGGQAAKIRRRRWGVVALVLAGLALCLLAALPVQAARNTKKYCFPLDTAVWRISDVYGKRIDPFTGKAAFHQGLDLACAAGTAVRAVQDGVVTAAAYSPSYGNHLRILHPDGCETRYAHLQYLYVRPGEVVQAGYCLRPRRPAGDRSMNRVRAGKLIFRDPVLLCGMVYLLLYFDASGFLRLGLLAAVLHELGHILVYCIQQRHLPVIEVTMTGFCMRTAGERLSPRQRLVLAVAGPAVNFALAGVWAVRLAQAATIRGSAFWAANLLTGLFNLLPIPPLDGAQMAAYAGALWRQKYGKCTQPAGNDCKTGTFGVK